MWRIVNISENMLIRSLNWGNRYLFPGKSVGCVLEGLGVNHSLNCYHIYWPPEFRGSNHMGGRGFVTNVISHWKKKTNGLVIVFTKCI